MFYTPILYLIIYLSFYLLTTIKKNIEDYINLGHVLNPTNNRKITFKIPNKVVNYKIKYRGVEECGTVQLEQM